jgi:3-hydroxybutyryl-CoA dehydrogenase
VSRGKASQEEVEDLLGRISVGTELASLKDCELVIEAVPERLELKKELFSQLDALLSETAVLATNTSALSVTDIATSTGRPSRVVGLHWFNPAPVMKLVEVVSTVVTDPGVVESVEALVAQVGKDDVTAGDRAGFIANALLFGYLNNAVRMYESKYASREDIDAAMRFGCGYPMGPLALLDLIGLDTAYEILETMYRQGRDRLHAPAPILKQMVTAGMLGRKSGRGFYPYEEPDSPVVVADEKTPSADDSPQLRHQISQVGVVGTGTMATGIVEVFAKAGYDVVYVGRSDEKVAKVAETIERSLDKAIQRGKLEEGKKAEVLGRLTGTTSLDDLARADLVVEAIAEDLKIKTTLFENLDEICKPGAILATTRSPSSLEGASPRCV